MEEHKNKNFISETILGREMTLRRALKYIFVSIISGLVFGIAGFFAFRMTSELTGRYRAGKEAAAEQELPPESTAEPETAADPSPSQETPESEQAPLSEPETGESPVDTEESSPEPAAAAENGETGDPDFTGTEGAEQDTSAAAEPVTVPEAGPVTIAEAPGAGPEGTGPVPAGSSSLCEEDVRNLILEERENYEYSGADLEALLSRQREACSHAASFIVTVDSIISETTWFESTIETRRSYAGVIISKDDREILVLTVTDALTGGDNLSVTFAGGARQNAILKKSSQREKLCVLAVPTEGLGEEFLSGVKAIELADLSERAAGEPVIAAGAPMGVVGSFDFGYINYAGSQESTVDGVFYSCYAKVNSRPELGTFLTDLGGNLLGIALNLSREEEDPVSGSRFISSRSLEPVIESLMKAAELPYLGISGTDISFDMKYQNMPEGLYVTDIEADSPAFAAGLKRGDIIVTADETEIKGSDDFLSFLRTCRPLSTVGLTVKRASGAGDYKDIELEITAAVR